MIIASIHETLSGSFWIEMSWNKTNKAIRSCAENIVYRREADSSVVSRSRRRPCNILSCSKKVITRLWSSSRVLQYSRMHHLIADETVHDQTLALSHSRKREGPIIGKEKKPSSWEVVKWHFDETLGIHGRSGSFGNFADSRKGKASSTARAMDIF